MQTNRDQTGGTTPTEQSDCNGHEPRQIYDQFP